MAQPIGRPSTMVVVPLAERLARTHRRLPGDQARHGAVTSAQTRIQPSLNPAGPAG